MLSLMIRKYLVWMSSYSTGPTSQFISCMGSLSKYLELINRQKPVMYATTSNIFQPLILILSENCRSTVPFGKTKNDQVLVIIIMGQTSASQIDNQAYQELVGFICKKMSSYGLIGKEQQRQRLCQAFQDSLKSEYHQKIMGCLFGAIIGDVLGAYCEFNPTNLTQEVLEQTMEMNGGGVFKLHKGQFTDDSELAYHLLKALTSLDFNQPLANQTQVIVMRIATEYMEWGKSNPFDIGITCRKGIDVLESLKVQRLDVKEILDRVKEVTGKSQSNGSLMRIAPMACFFALLQEDPEDYREFIENQISLIHNNEVLRQAGFIWVKVLFELIRRKDNNKSTYLSIFTSAQKTAKGKQLKQWFQLAKQEDKISAVQNMGWAKIAWTYGMNFLYNLATTQGYQLSYYSRIKDVIRQGGDSDTNAAIVGGMIGAVVGFKRLPTSYLSNIFKLEFPEEQHRIVDRPKKYEPFNVLLQLLRLKETCTYYLAKQRRPHKKPLL